jgi:hypothetical protein
MKLLLEYQEYVEYGDLLEKADPNSQLYREHQNYVSEIHESIFTKGGGDQILNTLSKSLFGSLSKVSMIDQTIEKIYSLKAKLVDHTYTVDKAFDAIADKVKKMRIDGASPEAIRAARKQRDAKESEFRALDKKTNLEIESGLKLLNDIIGGNKRRQAYADSVLAQAEVNLADYEYRKAKREGKATDREITSLMKKIEDKKKELKDETEDLEKLASSEKPQMRVTKGGKTA